MLLLLVGCVPLLFLYLWMVSCSFREFYWVMGERSSHVAAGVLALHVATSPYRSTLDNCIEAMTHTALAAQPIYLSLYNYHLAAGGKFDEAGLHLSSSPPHIPPLPMT